MLEYTHAFPSLKSSGIASLINVIQFNKTLDEKGRLSAKFQGAKCVSNNFKHIHLLTNYSTVKSKHV